MKWNIIFTLIVLLLMGFAFLNSAQSGVNLDDLFKFRAPKIERAINSAVEVMR